MGCGGAGQMNNPYILCACRLSVTVWQREWHWRQGKTAFPVFTHLPVEAFESHMNNKWYHDEGGSQSRNMERLKENGGVEKSFVFFIILTEQKKKILKEQEDSNIFCSQKLMQNEARSQVLPFSILQQTTKRQSWLALVSDSCASNSRSVEKAVSQTDSDTSEENTEPLAASCCNL